MKTCPECGQPVPTRHEVIRCCIHVAAAHYRVPVKAIIAPGRHRNSVRARQAACWLAREEGKTLGAIARVLGRDHTTIWHAADRVRERRIHDRAFRAETDRLAMELGQLLRLPARYWHEERRSYAT